MKTVMKTFILFLVFNAFTWIAPQKTVAQLTVSFQVFRMIKVPTVIG